VSNAKKPSQTKGSNRRKHNDSCVFIRSERRGSGEKNDEKILLLGGSQPCSVKKGEENVEFKTGAELRRRGVGSDKLRMGLTWGKKKKRKTEPGKSSQVGAIKWEGGNEPKSPLGSRKRR